MNKLFNFIILFSLTGMYSCLDPIDLDVPAKERETIIIQAKLSKGNPSIVEAAVNNLFDFTAASRLPVSVRSVLLLDEDGNSKELVQNDLGSYAIEIHDGDPDINIEYGKSYQLRVSTFDNRVFISDLEKLNRVPVPDNLTFQVGSMVDDSTGVAEPAVNVFLSTDLAINGGSEASKLRWDVEVAYQATDFPIDGTIPKTCWIATTPELSDIKTVNGDDIVERRVDDFPIAEIGISSIFAEGVYINVYQESLTDEALDYWQQVGQLVRRSGNMFEPPVGKLRTNFSNANDGVEDEVFGYFYASSREVIRVFVDPGVVGSPQATCPWTGQVAPGRGCTIPQICCDCSVLSGSSTVKPDYWQ